MAKKIKVKNHNTLMNEGPTVIGMMSAVIETGGSLDTAVRDVAKNGPDASASLFRSVVVKADTRQITDIKSGISEMLSSLPSGISDYRRSIDMVMAASASSDHSEKKRMLKDASEISLRGLKEIGESYSTSLNIPCMMIFGLGIMVPMVLMSILPMLNMGGIFGSSPISMDLIVVVTLVFIPAVIISLTFSVKEKNPFLRSLPKADLRYIAPLVMMVPMTLVVSQITGDTHMSIIAAALASGIISLAATVPYVNSEKKREKQEQLLQDSVFDLGNNMIGGDNFETAVIRAVESRPECKSVAENIAREMKMCRGDICSAIRASIGKISPHISETFCDVYRCSLKDVRDAGRLAVSIGRQLQDQDSIRKGIRNKLKSMTDMMIGTAAVFAPLVLGMSITMLEPISRIMDGVDLGDTSVILSAYLIELCILMAVLASFLNGKMDIRESVHRVGIMLPVSMVMFTLCSSIGL